MTAPKVIDVDPNGDVFLMCGAGHEITKIRVASMMLSYGSRVFKKMLSPKFKEGHQLAAASSVEIPLPDTDADVLEIMCKILHLRPDATPHTLSTDKILKLAELADYYDCAGTIGQATYRLVDNYLTSRTIAALRNFLASCFILRQPEMLEKVALELVLQNPGFIKEKPDARLGIPATFVAAEEIRKSTCDSLRTRIEDFIASCTYRGGSCTDNCSSADVILTAILRKLESKGIWPTIQDQQFPTRHHSARDGRHPLPVASEL